MPERLACPGCGRRVRVPDELIGHPVQCPACKTIFTSEDANEGLPPRSVKPPPRPKATPPPLPDEDEDEVVAGDEPEVEEENEDYPEDEPRRRPAKRRRPVNVDAWKSVRSGLGRIIAACFTMIGTWALVLLIYGIGFAVGISVLDPEAAMVIWGAAFATLVIGLIAVFALQFLGLSECREAPQKNGCYNLATISYNLLIGCVLAGVITVLISILSLAFAMAGVWALIAVTGALTFLASSIMGLLGLASVVCFIFFMRAVSFTVKSPGQAANCLFLAIAYLIVFPLGCTGIGGIWFLPGLVADPESVGPIALLPICCGIGGNLLPLAVGIWYIITIFMVRDAVQDYLEGNV